MTGLPRLFTAAEVAEALRVTEYYVEQQTLRRAWPHRRGPRGVRLFTAEDVAAITDLMAQQVENAPAPRVSFAPRSRRGAA